MMKVEVCCENVAVTAAAWVLALTVILKTKPRTDMVSAVISGLENEIGTISKKDRIR